MKYNKIISIFKKNNGYLKSSELINYKVHTSYIKKLLDEKKIEQIKRGLYRLPADMLNHNNKFTHDYIDTAVAIPNAIFCLSTALSYHELCTYNPGVFDIAILPTQRNIKLNNISIKYYRFQEPFYSYGIIEIATGIKPIKIYNAEKTVCDMIRLRHLVGEDIAMEGLNNYIKKQNKNINYLFETAKLCRIKHIIEPAVKAMIGF